MVVEKLQGASNYRPWRRSLEITLASKRKLGFVTGTVKRDERDEVKDTCNNMVISWILSNVSDSIKRSVMYMSNAKQIWDKLQSRFLVASGARKYHLRKLVYETKQNGKPLTEYYTEMSTLWEELENLNELPPITLSVREVQDFMTAFRRMQEDERLFEFLNGLDETFSMQRSNMLMKSPLPTVEDAYNVLQQEESQRETLKSVKEETEGAVMYSKSSKECTVCNKIGHTKEECWHVKGFPAWMKKGQGIENKERKEFPQDRRGGRGFRGQRGGRSGRGGGRYAGNNNIKTKKLMVNKAPVQV